MKSCPLCGAKATDGAATCFECLYSFSAMSARTSTLVDQTALQPTTPLSLALSDGHSRRAVIKATKGCLYVASQAAPGARKEVRSPDLRWRKSAASVIVEPLGRSCVAMLNGVPLTNPAVVTVRDVVELAGTYMSVRD